MEKSALASQVVAKTAKPLWQYVLGALGTATAMEGVQASLPGSNYTDQPAATILSRVATNMLFGGAGAHKGVTGWLGATATAPVKDIGISALANDTVGHFTEAQKTQAAKNKAEEDKSNLTAWLLGGLGLGALGLGGLALYKYWNQKDPVAAKNGARLRYRLAGDDALPGREAEVDIPISSPDITDKMLENLDSGMRRQLRKTIKLNSRKKDPITGKLISYDAWTDKYGEHGEFLPDKYKTDETMIDLEKASSYMADRARVAGYTWCVMTKCAEQLPPPEDSAAGQPPPPAPQQSTPGNQATQQVSPEAEGKAHAPQRSSRTSSIDKIEHAVHGVHSTLAHMANKESIRLSAQANASAARQPWDDLKNRIAAMGGQQ